MPGGVPYPSIGAAIDGSESDDAVLAVADAMAGLGAGARLVLVHVASVPPPPADDPSYSGWLGAGAVVDSRPFLDAGRELLARVGRARPSAAQVLLEGDPPEAVCDYAAEVGLDLLVVGSRRHHRRIPIGTFARYVTHRAPCSVALARPRGDG